MDFNIVVAAYDWKFTRSLVHQKFYSQPPGIFWNVQQNKNLWTCFDTADSVDDMPAQWVSFKCKCVINFCTVLFEMSATWRDNAQETDLPIEVV